MKLERLLTSIEYTTDASYDRDFDIEELCHDSRRTREATLFICIQGATSDGHNYAYSAYSRGCRHFVAERELDLPDDAAVFTVADTRKALASLSAEFFGHPSDELFIIGLTGTKGKTTTALMIYNILNACGLKCGYIGSNGIDFGDFHYEAINTTPESHSLQRYMREMRLAGVKYLAMEVSSQSLYMSRVYGIKFDLCVYTNLSKDHIGGAEHPTFEHYLECKRSLFSDYGAKAILYNTDDGYAKEMISGAPVGAKLISYAVHGDADYKAMNLEKFRGPDTLGVSFDMLNEGAVYSSSIAFPGNFSVYNALAAIAACRECGLELDKVCETISDVQIKGRFENIRALPYATFIIDYAHNEVSLTSALDTLRSYEPKRLICLFGSVGGRTKGRRAELGRVAAELADFSIITSDNPDFENPDDVIRDIETQFAGRDNYIKIADRRKAIEYAVNMAKDGDVFLFAGKGHETYQLINGEKIPFSEKEILLEACKRLSGQTI